LTESKTALLTEIAVFPFHQRKIPSRLPAAFPPVFKRIFLAASPGKIHLKKNASANGKGFEITITGANCDRRDAWPSGGSTPSLYPIIPPDSTKYRTLQLLVIKKTVPDKNRGLQFPLLCMVRSWRTAYLPFRVSPCAFFPAGCMASLRVFSHAVNVPLFCISIDSLFLAFSSFVPSVRQTSHDILRHVMPTHCQSNDYSKISIYFWDVKPI